MDTKVILANSFDIKDLIKSKGGVYNAERKAWIVSPDAYERLHEIMQRPSIGMREIRGWAKVQAYCAI